MPENIAVAIASLFATIFTFLFGLEKFSGQIERLAGDRFKDLVQRSTSKPLKATFVGIFVTVLFSSSTAVSVLLISLAKANVIPLYNSLGVIIGTNIGTTFTTQLVAFQILQVAPYILILGFLLMHVKTPAQRYGKAIFYFGLVFSSLLIMSEITDQFSNHPALLSLASHTSNLFIAILAGIFLSTILQSSLAAATIVIILSGQGLLSFEQSLGIILGTNIGTTVTALLASLVSDKNGKQVALGHLLFNVVGVILFTPLVNPVVQIFSSINISLPHQVTLSHLLFNVFTAIIFLTGFQWFYKGVISISQIHLPKRLAGLNK